MTSTAEIRNGVCFVTLTGEVDRSHVDALAAEIEACLSQAKHVVFDFSDLSFANGAVMALLHDVLDRLAPGGLLGIVSPRAEIERLFQVAGLSKRSGFRVFRSMDEAVQATDEI